MGGRFAAGNHLVPATRTRGPLFVTVYSVVMMLFSSCESSRGAQRCGVDKNFGGNMLSLTWYRYSTHENWCLLQVYIRYVFSLFVHQD
jgi:hypothetical protein